MIAVVPSFQEEELIGETVHALLSISSIDRVIVVDDASTDGTAVRAAAAGAEVVVNGKNLGKGSSLDRVLPSLEFDTLLLVDGDLGKHASDASLLLEVVTSGEADIAIAAFPPADLRGGFGFAQGLGRRGIERLAGVTMRSPLSGQRAMARAAYELVAPLDRGFGVEVGMTIDALRSGLRVVEVETAMSHRETGRDLAGFVHRGNQFRDIAFALLRRTFRRGG